MKKKTILSFCLSFVLGASFPAQPADLMNFGWQNWSSGAAHLLPPKRVEIGLFQPLRYGYSESLEFSIHPLLFFVMPNMDVKWAHNKVGGVTLASVHGLSYPTPLMRLMAKEGIGGIISPEFTIPQIFSFQNELLASTAIFDKHLFTGKLAFNFAVKSGPLDPRTTIDLPIVYIRSGVYYYDYGLKLGADVKGSLAGPWSYAVDGDFFYYPKAKAQMNMAFEHKGLIYWNKSSAFQLCFGYILSYGQYPYGSQWHLLPLVDVQWGWTRK